MTCERCRRPIPKARLAVVPDARRCVGCQGRFDLTPQEQFGSRLEMARAVNGERDGEQFQIGGDSRG